MLSLGVHAPLTGCSEESTADTQTFRNVVYEEVIAASFHPAAYIAGRIAGSTVPVWEVTPIEADPGEWMPDAAAISRMQRARLTVVNGAGFERWVKAVSLPQHRLCVLAKGLREPLLQLPEVTHSHGGAGAHTHAGTDGHIWMEPVMMGQLATHLRDRMLKAWPQHEAIFIANYEQLSADLAALDVRLAGLSPLLSGRVLIASHPSYGYLARRYGWNVVNIDLPPESAPTEKALAQLDALEGERFILFEEQPSDVMQSALAARQHIHSVVYSPSETNPACPPNICNYLTVMNGNIDRLAASLTSAAETQTR